MINRFCLARASVTTAALELLTAGLVGCASYRGPNDSLQPAVSGAQVTTTSSTPFARGVIAGNDRFVLYAPGAGDTLASLAQRFLGSESRAWEIAEVNGITRVEAGTVVAIALQATNPKRVSSAGFQTVPILCYHRFGPQPGKMVVTPEAFAKQLDYLAQNGYSVVPLSDLIEFLDGTRALPRRAVVITVDDGHISSYRYAYPLLKQHGFPATFFLYSDFIGAGEALRWTQVREMAGSGLIDFQAHSKTHTNLAYRLEGESERHYQERLDTEIRQPRDLLERNIPGKVVHYAYPYGDANETMLERLGAAKYRLAVTVNPGGNAFFSHPLMLRRTMVFGEQNLDASKTLLQVFKAADLR